MTRFNLHDKITSCIRQVFVSTSTATSTTTDKFLFISIQINSTDPVVIGVICLNLSIRVKRCFHRGNKIGRVGRLIFGRQAAVNEVMREIRLRVGIPFKPDSIGAVTEWRDQEEDKRKDWEKRRALHEISVCSTLDSYSTLILSNLLQVAASVFLSV